jgi:hypothetical protein
MKKYLIPLILLASCQKSAQKPEALSSSTISNSSVAHKTFIIPFDTRDEEGDIWNPCTGEDVHIFGTLIVQSTQLFNNNSIVLNSAGRWDIQGIGDESGLKYLPKIHDAVQEQFRRVDTVFYTDKLLHQNLKFTILLPGTSEKYTSLSVQAIWVIKKDGSIAVQIEKYEFDSCK